MTQVKNYTKEEFIKDVTKEIKSLKRLATKEEIQHLDIESLDPDDARRCIYGQMTGDCTSERASELIYSCCPRYINNTGSKGQFETFASVKKQVNGKQIDRVSNLKDFMKTRWISITHFSSLETYILLPTAKKKNIIDFLKGKRKDLVL